MLNISLRSDLTTVTNPKTYAQWTIKTPEIFGTLYAALEKHFPELDNDDFSERIIKHVFGKMRGEEDENPTWIFHVPEIGSTLYNLKAFIDDRDSIILTIKDIEEMRVHHFMTANFLPVSLDDQDSMRFENLKSVTEVAIAILYYYAYNDYKLVRCKHCGKWFATKTLKEQYCKRISPCFGDIITGKVPVSCEQAVRNIKQKQMRRRRNIYEYLNNYATYQEEIEDFKAQCKYYKEIITKAPTVENFRQYEQFLNSDKYPKRMVRQ